MNGKTYANNSVMGTLFRVSVLKGVQEVVLHYIKSGKNIDVRDGNGQSALMLAASRGHLHVCKLLVEAGGDISLQDSKGRNALSLARQQGFNNIAEFLQQTMQSTVNHEQLGMSAEKASFAKTADAILQADLMEWEETSDLSSFMSEPNYLLAAKDVQDRISAHVPIDVESDWAEITVDLPPICSEPIKSVAIDKQNETIIRPPKTSLAGKIWAAADELTVRKKVCAAIADLLRHPATSGVYHKTVKSEYERWKLYCSVETNNLVRPGDVFTEQLGSITAKKKYVDVAPLLWGKPKSIIKPVRSLSAPSSFPTAPSQVVKKNIVESKTDKFSTSGQNLNDEPIGRPLLTSWAAKLWAAADELTKRNGAPATITDLLWHSATHNLGRKTIETEYLRWRAYHDAKSITCLVNNAIPFNQPLEDTAAGVRPRRSTIAGAIWAAADNLIGTDARSITLTRLLDYPTLEGFNQQTVKMEFANWRAYNGLPALVQSQLVIATNLSSPKARSAPMALTPPKRSASWEETAKYLAESASLTVKDMRPKNGYFWVLVTSVGTGKLRTLARKLLGMGFEHIENCGFRKK